MKTLNTYISIDLYFWKEGSYGHSSGHIYTHNKKAKLQLHLDVDYETAKKELAKLMLRTGKLPRVVGKNDPDMVMYTLDAFLD